MPNETAAAQDADQGKKKAEPKRKTPKPSAHKRSRLTPEGANPREKRIFAVLAAHDGPVEIREVAKEAWPGKKADGDAEYEHQGKAARNKERKSPLSAYRQVVNNVRRATAAGLIRKPKVGFYELTAKGREFAKALT